MQDSPEQAQPAELPPASASPDPPVASPAAAKAVPTGMAAVARKVSRRTTDLLAIAIVGIGIFAVSGRISDWWNTSPESVIAHGKIVPEVVGAEVSWPEMDIPVGVNLGNFPVRVERLLIRGDLRKLEEVVFDRLQTVLGSENLSGQLNAGESRVALAAAKLESLLTGIKPAMERPGVWRIYRLDEPGTPGFAAMFLGTRTDAKHDRDSRREWLVTWAMAMPWRDDDWKVFFFQPVDEDSASIALPPGAELTMSMQEPSGTELAAFRATDSSFSLNTWREFYSTRLTEAGWKPVREWAQSGARHTARFENGTLAVEFILKTDDDTLSGLANVIRLPEAGTSNPE